MPAFWKIDAICGRRVCRAPGKANLSVFFRQKMARGIGVGWRMSTIVENVPSFMVMMSFRFRFLLVLQLLDCGSTQPTTAHVIPLFDISAVVGHTTSARAKTLLYFLTTHVRYSKSGLFARRRDIRKRCSHGRDIRSKWGHFDLCRYYRRNLRGSESPSANCCCVGNRRMARIGYE